MNRIIKFRAWDGKEMHHNVSIVGGMAYRDGYCGNILNPDAKGGSPMQYTGLHDKNRKEIYEGDILSVDPLSIYERKTVIVKWQDWFSQDYWMKKTGGWKLEKITLGIMQIWTEKTIEIIGNIYENSELLEDKS